MAENPDPSADIGPTEPEGFDLDTHVLDDFTDQIAHMPNPRSVYDLLTSHIGYYDTDELRGQVPHALAFFRKRHAELKTQLGIA